MRVKIGDKWYFPEPGQPVAVELTEGDRTNIANMAPTATRYAEFDDRHDWTSDEMRAWLAAD